MKPGLLFAVVLLLATAGPWAPTARAQDSPDAQLASVRELVLHANYRAALPAARTFLERTDLPAAARNAGLEILATVHLALRDETAAREALGQLFARDPGHRLADPDASPVVQSAFARAREGARPVTVAVEHEPPVLARRAAPTVTVQITEGADAVHEVRLAYRHAGETTRWTTIVMPMELDGSAQGRIPITREDDAAYTIEYYLEALAPSSTVLGRSGSDGAALTLEVPAAAVVVATASTDGTERDTAPVAGGDVTGEAWFWVVIGLVVVGAGVGVGVGVTLGTQGPESGSLGDVTLPLVRF